MAAALRRVALWLLAIVAALPLLLVAALAAVTVAAHRPDGRVLIERLTAGLSRGHVRVGGLSGDFPASIDLATLQLADDRGVWLRAEDISLRWSPWKILQWRIEARSLFCRQLQIVRRPEVEEDEGGGPISMPHIDVGQLRIPTLQLGAALVGAAASMQVSGSAQLPSTHDIALLLLVHRIDGVGDYNLHFRLGPGRMDADLALHEPADGPLSHLIGLPGLGALSVSGSIRGPHAQEQVQLGIAAGPAHGTIAGTLDIEHGAATLDYAVDSPALQPRHDVGWGRLVAQGHFEGPFNSPTLSLQLQAQQVLVPGSVRLGSLRADVTGRGGALSARATVTGALLPGPRPRLLAGSPVALQASMQLNDPALPLQFRVTHALIDLTTRIDRMNVPPGASQNFDVQLKLPDFTPLGPLIGRPLLRGSAQVSGRLRRTHSTWHMDLGGNVAMRGPAPWAGLLGGSTRLQVASVLAPTGLTISRLQVDGRALSLSLDGSAGWGSAGLNVERAHTGPGVDARWTLALRDLTLLQPALAGTLAASGDLSGPRTALATDLQLQTRLSVHGTPAGTVTASLHATGLPGRPSGRLQAQGVLAGAPLQLDLLLEHRADGSLYAAVQRAQWRSGRLAGQLGSDSGLNHLNGRFTLAMTQLADLAPLLGTSLQGALDGELGLASDNGRVQMHLQLRGSGLLLHGVGGGGQLHADGPLDALKLQLALQVPQLHGAAASLASTALLDLPARALQLQQLQATYRGQALRLQAPARLSFGDGLQLQPLQLGAGGAALLSVQGRFTPQWDLSASLRHAGPALVNTFIPDALGAGDIEAELRLHGRGGQTSGHISLDATGLRASDQGARGLPSAELHVAAALGQGAAAIDARLMAGNHSTLVLTGSAPLDPSGQLALKASGEVNAGIINPLLEARGRRAAGRLALDAQVTGPMTSPQIKGTLLLSQGDWRDYTLGMHLEDIAGRFEGDGGMLRIQSLVGHAGGGEIQATGTIGLLQPGVPVDLKLTASNAQPITNSLLTAKVDASLAITGKARQRVDVVGRIHVDRAVIGIPDSFPPDVAVLDVRRPGQAAVVPVKPLIVGVDVTIDAPRQVLVQGRGLDAELGGDLHLGNTLADPKVSGGFDLQRGTFTLASSRLQFTSGRVSFNGSGLHNRIDPTLDFEAQAAESTAGNNIAKLTITGLADDPKFTLSSSPASQPQDEILSELLFGESAAQLSALQAAQIGAALATLGGIGGSGSLNPLVKIQKTLGLDRLSVSGGATSNGTTPVSPADAGTSIEAGRYVSDRVYVGGKQSSTGFSQLEVDVDLAKHLKVQTRLGNGTASAQGTTPENDPGSSVGLSYSFDY